MQSQKTAIARGKQLLLFIQIFNIFKLQAIWLFSCKTLPFVMKHSWKKITKSATNNNLDGVFIFSPLVSL